MAWERDGSFITGKRQHMYPSGGANHQGVGICISAHFAAQITSTSFHAHSKKNCSLHFSMASKRFRVFSVYLPTVWDADGAVEQMYDVSYLLVDASKQGTHRSSAVLVWGGPSPPVLLTMHLLGSNKKMYANIRLSQVKSTPTPAAQCKSGGEKGTYVL